MIYIEYYDPRTELSFEIPELDMSGFASIEEAMVALTPEVHAAVLSALHNAAELEIDRVPVFVVAGGTSVILLDREEYLNKLESTLSYFQELEEYELCSHLIEIRKKLS